MTWSRRLRSPWSPGSFPGPGWERGCRAAPPTEGHALPRLHTDEATSRASVSPTHPGTAVSHHQWDLRPLPALVAFTVPLGLGLVLPCVCSGPLVTLDTWQGSLFWMVMFIPARTWNQDILRPLKSPFVLHKSLFKFSSEGLYAFSVRLSSGC